MGLRYSLIKQDHGLAKSSKFTAQVNDGIATVERVGDPASTSVTYVSGKPLKHQLFDLPPQLSN